MKITFCGLPGVGKGALGKAFALKHNLKFASGGDIFRSWAKELDMPLNEFEKKVISDPDTDIKLDDRIAQFGKENDNFIFDSRLAWHNIPDSIKIKIVCDENVRLERAAKRDNVTYDEAKKNSDERTRISSKRYDDLYGIKNFLEDNHFDHILDTTGKSVEEEVLELEKMIGINK